MICFPPQSYAVWMRAQNEYGLSAASDTLTAMTNEPSPPTGLTASLIYPSPVSVELHWENHTTSDSLYVSRRKGAGAWTTIHAEAGPPYYSYSGEYTDTTVAAGTTYDYRVGIGFLTGTWWSADSVKIVVP